MVVNHTTVVRAKRNYGHASLPSETNNFMISFMKTPSKITTKKIPLQSSTRPFTSQAERIDEDRQKDL